MKPNTKGKTTSSKDYKSEIYKIVRWYGGRPEDKYIKKHEDQTIDALLALITKARKEEWEKCKEVVQVWLDDQKLTKDKNPDV